MKGILLAGGSGKRLDPLTKIVSKHLLPIYDKPLVYYPLSTLMLSNIRDIMIITSPTQSMHFNKLLGNGKELGIKLSYEIQEKPLGIAESLLIGSEFIQGEKVCLILGDNLFHGSGLGRRLELFKNVEGAQVFGYQVGTPSSYGIATVSENNSVIKLEEKPEFSESNIAIPGLYFFDETASERSQVIKPSKRGELEILTLLESYLRDNLLRLEMLPRGTAWFDCGTFDDLHEAGAYVKMMEKRSGERVSDPSEIAKLQGWVR